VLAPLGVSPLLIVHWFHTRFSATTGFSGASSRLYGVEVIDPDLLDEGGPGARSSFLGEDPDARDLVARLVGDAARFDAAALVGDTWVTTRVGMLRPGAFPVRRRARVVTVVTDDGAATAIGTDDGGVGYALGAAATDAGLDLADRWAAARARPRP
jgi:hypothetical protein